jgi:hypothetical protein
MRRLLPFLLLLVLVGVSSPTRAAQPTVVSKRSPTVSWQGHLNGSAPLGCGNPSSGCDERDIVVDAAKGSWVTIAADLENATIRVTSGGAYVGSGGSDLSANPSNTPHASTTFQQLRSGRVTYHVAVGTDLGAPDVQTPVGGSDSTYTGSARLAGTAFDRAGECGVTPGAEQLQEPDDGRLLPLSVRLVAEPRDAAAARAAGKALVEIYRRIGVVVRVSYDFRTLTVNGSEAAYLGVWRTYGGLRPRGVDVVHVMTDRYAGGVADCIGGVAYPEKGFSVGGINYNVQGTVTLGHVPAGMVAAHEIGHLLGAQHQQMNCVEAGPQQAAQPASDGWVGACTVMSPAALLASETFSTLERTTIRSYVRRYAKG